MRLVRDNHQGGTQFAPVLSGAEVNAFFAALRKPKYRALFMTCYAAGLRLGEACHLRVEALDLNAILGPRS